MRRIRSMLLAFGAVLWIGALSPEIFIDAGAGCIFDGEGNALDRDAAGEFMERYFYGGETEDNESAGLEIKFGLLQWLNGG